MTVLGQMSKGEAIAAKHVKDCAVSQKTSAEGKYTLGLQPPLKR